MLYVTAILFAGMAFFLTQWFTGETKEVRRLNLKAGRRDGHKFIQ